MRLLLRITLAVLLCLQTVAAFSQSAQQIGCVEPVLRQQARELQQQFIEQGFTVSRDAMIHMSSNEPFPVVVELQKGVFYQFIFIGNTRAQKLTLELYDNDQKRLALKTSHTGKDEANYIFFSFVPEKSGPYVFALTQKVKQKAFCGSFTIMELKDKE